MLASEGWNARLERLIVDSIAALQCATMQPSEDRSNPSQKVTGESGLLPMGLVELGCPVVNGRDGYR